MTKRKTPALAGEQLTIDGFAPLEQPLKRPLEQPLKPPLAPLSGGRLAVWRELADHEWHALARIARKTRIGSAVASARLRDLRKPKYGGMTIERRRTPLGAYEYRLQPDDQAQED